MIFYIYGRSNFQDFVAFSELNLVWLVSKLFYIVMIHNANWNITRENFIGMKCFLV